MNTLIVLAYFDRPQMVRDALQSIKAQTSDEWHLAFCDDGSKTPGKDICLEYISETKVSFYRLHDSPEQKMAQGGSYHGKMMNEAILSSDCDNVVILCDDDCLVSTYIEELNLFYQSNPSIKYSYCHISPYNPLEQTYNDICSTFKSHAYNYTHDLSPSCTVDSAQVSYRVEAFLTDPKCSYPLGTRNLDSSMYVQLEEKYGLCKFNGIIGQHKGWFQGQMTYQTNPYGPIDR